jgi:hypothetical protein
MFDAGRGLGGVDREKGIRKRDSYKDETRLAKIYLLQLSS